MYLIHVCIPLILFNVITSHALSMDVDCFTDGSIVVVCKVSGVTFSTTLKQIKAETTSKECVKGFDYNFEYLDHDQGLIYAVYQCGGKFRLTQETWPTWQSWGAWSACSVSCGPGTKTRTRTCTTGDNSYCSRDHDAGKGFASCNEGSCNKIKESIDAVCSRPFLTDRILGGILAKECEYPWMVFFYNKNSGNFCGGSIVDNNHILTAAHCVRSNYSSYHPKDLVLVSGASLITTLNQTKLDTNTRRQYPYMRFRYVSNIRIHQGFVDDFLTNDIAVLTLTESIVFDKCHVPVCLASDYPPNLTNCKVMGWGATSDGQNAGMSRGLLFTEVNVVNPGICGYRFIKEVFNKERQICVDGNGRATCKGDSGGPFVCPGPDGRSYQYGIVSGGIPGSCGTEPQFYTKVSNYGSWIEKNTDLGL